MSRSNFADASLQLWKVSFIYLPVMRGDGETFSLNERARNAGEFFSKLFFGRIQRRQELSRLLSPQPARSGNIKSVAASVNESIDINALANVVELAAAEDCDRDSRR